MKCWSVFVWLLLTSYATAGTGKISGTVVDQNGSPVAHIMIEFWPTGQAWSGGFPLAETDEHGHFVKEVGAPYTWNGRNYGRWAIYPFDEAAYYPRMSSFYTTDKAAPVHVELTPENPEAVVEIRLGVKAGAITGRVTDSITGETLNPEFDLAWASGEPSKRMGISMREPYRILLPANTDIKLLVQCEGHKPWTYPGVINVGPGQGMHLDIKLEPEPALHMPWQDPKAGARTCAGLPRFVPGH